MDVLRLRAEIMSNYFEKIRRNNIICIVDCSCNVTRIFEGLLLNEFYSAQHENICPICDFKTESTCPILPLEILILAENGLTTGLDKSANSIINVD